MEWIPDSTQTQFETTALKNLIRVSTNSNSAQLIKEVPIEKMEEFVHKIEEIKKTILSILKTLKIFQTSAKKKVPHGRQAVSVRNRRERERICNFFLIRLKP